MHKFEYNILYMKTLFLSLLPLLTLVIACKKDGCTDPEALNYSKKAKHKAELCEYAEQGPYLIFKLNFDSTAVRLDNFGQPATIPAGNAAQSPVMHKMSAHYIELAQNAYTQLGNGAIIFRGKETTTGGDNAVDFSQAIVKGNGEVFYKIPLKDVQAGNYEWIRVSLTYQNYDIKYKLNSNGINGVFTGRLASFVGFNNFIQSYTINTQSQAINANKLQGYWAFESFGQVISGQAPVTTTPNPLSATSPVPANSCIVTGTIENGLQITGNETQDIVVTLHLTTNKSFEWTEITEDGLYEPLIGETPVDMGLRGLKATKN